jgi:hypothetical protein
MRANQEETMACDERGHRALEQAIGNMREQRDQQTRKATSLQDNLVGLEAKVQRLQDELREEQARGFSMSAELDALRIAAKAAAFYRREGVRETRER